MTKSAACFGATSGSSRMVKLPFAVSTTASVPGATGGSFAAAGFAGFGAASQAGAWASAADAAQRRGREEGRTRRLLMATSGCEASS